MTLFKKATLIQNIKKNGDFYNVICFLKENSFNNKNNFVVNDIFENSIELKNPNNINIDYSKIINKLLLITCFFDFKKNCFITKKIEIL